MYQEIAMKFKKSQLFDPIVRLVIFNLSLPMNRNRVEEMRVLNYLNCHLNFVIANSQYILKI